jgi:hypothetical protein
MTTYNGQITYDKERKQRYWSIAIGLNKVDELLPSKYLLELLNIFIVKKHANVYNDRYSYL